ncbi:MAG: CHAT domain-containing protein [Holophagales bacterium]|nr:CHAT domain-containing protein [Holophagales bacterium]
MRATGTLRWMEPRLSGGFTHAPPELPVEPEREGAGLSCCAAHREQLLGDREVLRLGRKISRLAGPATRGLWRLLSADPGELEGAISLLSAAAREGSADPGVWNDLGVAYLRHARSTGSGLDFLDAFEACERALELDPSHLEASFNRALLLQRLGLSLGAAPAWKRYSELDPGSGWRREALSHLRRLESEPPSPDGESLEEALDTDPDRFEAALERALVERTGEVRRLGLDSWLPAWAEAWQSGDRKGAERRLERLERMGSALRAATGDEALFLTAAALRAAMARGPEAVDRLASAHLDYRAGLELRSQSRYLEASEVLERARLAAEPFESPLAAWAEFWQAAADSSANRYAEVFERVRRIRSRTRLEGLPYLEARLHWVRGLVEVRTGLLAESLTSFLEAASVFERLGEPRLRGAALALAAESRRWLGQHDEAWELRLQAFPRLGLAPNRYLQNLLVDTAGAASDAGRHRAAIALQTLGVENARALGSSSRAAEALLWRAKALEAAGRFEAAAADLDHAEAEVERVEDPELHRKQRADLDEARGWLLLSVDAPEARLPLARAIRAYQKIGYTFRLPRLHGGMARALLAYGDPESARRQLEAGVELFEKRDARIGAAGFRYQHFEQAQELFDALITYELDRDRPWAALAAAERGRLSMVRGVATAGRLLHGGGGIPEQQPSELASIREAASRLSADTALISYALLGDRLVYWRIHSGQLHCGQVAISAERLVAEIQAFAAASASGRHRLEIEARSGELYRRLIAPAIAGLPPRTRLVLVPDRALAGLPFAALRDPESGRYLIRDHPISSSLGLGFYTGGGRGSPEPAPSEGRVLVVGDPLEGSGEWPSLPGAVREAGDVAAVYPGAVWISREEATKPRLLEALEQAELFHFAGHGVDDGARPWASHLPLASAAGGAPARLYAHELLGLRLPRLRLAVLASCRSAGAGRGRVMAASGLALGFLEAGVPNVVASLWDLPDVAARQLLLAFHHRLAETGDPADSLRLAMLDRLALGEGPEVWAALTLWNRL